MVIWKHLEKDSDFLTDYGSDCGMANDSDFAMETAMGILMETY
jgi:hypothetical protein